MSQDCSKVDELHLSADEAELRASIVKKRQKIDEIDKQLVALLNERACVSLEIREIKDQLGMSLYIPQREAELIEALRMCNQGPLYGENIAEIYRCILSVMRKL